MLKKVLSLIGTSLCAVSAFAQLNMTQLGHVDYRVLHNTGCAGHWAYVDELGNEYAIVGLNDGVSIVDVTDPANPQEIWFQSGISSVWREVKVWNDYAYVTTDMNGIVPSGLLVIDLSPLPQSHVLPTQNFSGSNGPHWTSAHTLYIDENGILHINGANRGSGGTVFYDLTQDPVNPPEVGNFDMYYTHDSYARGDTLYSAHILDGFFSIVDISDKANPVVLGTQSTPHYFTHNCWLSDDGRYLFTTDEVSGAYIASYDISDPENIIPLDRIQSNPGSGSVPHNVHYLNGWLVTAYYRDGVTIHDAHNPANLVEVGNIDVSPLSGDGFNSIWGVYPYLPSGNILATDREQGLFIFSADYKRAAYLEGQVTNANTGVPVNNAEVLILNTGTAKQTGLTGHYKTGVGVSGAYDIRISRAGYHTDTLFNVTLTAGDTVVLNHQLVPFTMVTMNGIVREEGTGTPIANALVEVKNEDFSFSATTNASGNYSISNIPQDRYQILAGKWGYITNCWETLDFPATDFSHTIELPKGYYDDFYFDFGWTVSGNATQGQWVRDVPIPTGLSGGIPVNPWFDWHNDCGEEAYVTGNSAGSVTSNDVEGGVTILTSPVFDASGFTDPWIGYSTWFINGYYNPPHDDVLEVKITNGTDTVVVNTIQASNTAMSQWVEQSTSIVTHLTPTATMRVIFSVEEKHSTNTHLLESGVDRFYVSEGNRIDVEETLHESGIRVFPNPFEENVVLELQAGNPPGGQLYLYDITGKLLWSQLVPTERVSVQAQWLVPGLYILTYEAPGQKRYSTRLVKH